MEVGKVTKVEPKDGGAAEVTMELKDDALPIHDDARAQIRSRIFLEGNFFVDIQPGSPSAGDLDDGSTLPITQTAHQRDAAGHPRRAQLGRPRATSRRFLHEYGTVALQGGGAKAFNRAIKSFEPAYRYGALTNDALLGVDPDRDVQRLLRGQQKTFAALASQPGRPEGARHRPEHHRRARSRARTRRSRRPCPRCATRCARAIRRSAS